MMPTPINRATLFPSLGEKESLGELLGNLAGHSAALVKNEFELASVELHEKASQYSKALMVLTVASFIGLLGAGALCAASINALSYYIGFTNSALLIGAALLLIGFLLLRIGINQVKEVRPRLNQSLATLEENTQWAQSQLK